MASKRKMATRKHVRREQNRMGKIWLHNTRKGTGKAGAEKERRTMGRNNMEREITLERIRTDKHSTKQ